MAARAFISGQLATARDPIKVPNAAKASTTDGYGRPLSHWDANSRTVYDHYRPSVPAGPPLGALSGEGGDYYARATHHNHLNGGDYTAADSGNGHNPLAAVRDAVEDRNPYMNAQQQHGNGNRENGASQPNSASVSTIKHNDAYGVNTQPTRAGAVGVASPLGRTAVAGAAGPSLLDDVTASAHNVLNQYSPPLHQLQKQQQQKMTTASSFANTGHSSSSSSLPAPSAAAAGAAVQHLMAQIQFLHKEVERLEGELATTRSENAATMRRLFEGGNRSGMLRGGTDLSQIADGSAAADASAAAAATAVLGPAAASRRLHERQLQIAAAEAQQLSQRCRTLESQLAAANAAKCVAIDEKLELMGKLKKLEATLKGRKASAAEAEESLTASTDEATRLKARLEETQKEFVKLARQLDAANDDLRREQADRADAKARLVSSFTQCGGDPEETEADFVGGIGFGSAARRSREAAIGTEAVPRADACCQVDTTMTRLYGPDVIAGGGPHRSSSSASGAAPAEDASSNGNNNNSLLFMMGIAGGNGIGADNIRNQVNGAIDAVTGTDGTTYSVPAAAASAVGAVNYNNMAHLLQTRCAELDTARGDLHRLAEAHKEALQSLDGTKKRLAAELDRRRVVESDAERLALQVRALQQQSSLLSSQLREKDELVERFQSDAQTAIAAALKMEQERAGWEADLSSSAKDVQSLVTSHQLAQQQLATVSTENEELKKEAQRLLQLEATNQMAYRAKESELAEVLQAYQLTVREGEANVTKFRAIERESENLRAQLSVKEERVVHLSEQVAALHAREQQLTLDLQSFDYEGGQLQRRIIAGEQTIATLNAQINDLQQHGLAFQRLQHELEAGSTELSKRLVIRDQECMHLRMRCDQLEQECTALSTARVAESGRLRELEDLNAQQRVREVLYKNAAAASSEQQSQVLNRELERTRANLKDREAALTRAQREADDERIRCEEYVVRLKEVEHLAAVAEGERQRLERLVEEQAAALDKLAQ